MLLSWDERPLAKITLASGKSFASEGGASLLDASASAGITLPYSCRTGRCSTCKAQVKAGVTRPLSNELGLTDNERASGWILTCVRTAESDVNLEIEDLGEVTLPKPVTLPCRISDLKLVAKDVLRVRLRLPPTATFSHIPGQYINLIGNNGVRRSYSLANASYAGKYLELHVKAVPGGLMSDYWFNHAKINDLLRLNGPLGTFFLRAASEKDVFFLATGTGIAPIHAILASLAQASASEQPKSVTILWGGRTREDLYLNLREIPGRHEFIPVLSRSITDWEGSLGYVQNVLLSRAPDLSNAAVYACGSDQMIHDAKKRLSAAGLPSREFYADAFVSSS